ncbi:alpha-glucan family phosphorylase [Georgenia sp. TF02-10]|uniref:alpha-glucan family phosphorylase n=1 Tax=Georgenia sp. TF02-10 TaxID=2917725 RepID=UPI001FA7BC83|nr:alpha-glucan family phosphorylase [Georgenia sp. TF02-10]UNX53962.1 alpha-glucan family phosphorylase [Georgenia sp. TF02-10]
MRAIRRFTVRTVLPEPLAPLDTLALNLRWSWHAPTRDLFASLDPALWRAVDQDPVALLGSLAPRRLRQLGEDRALVAQVRELAEDLQRYLTEPRWYQRELDDPDKPAAVAYFSAEYGITAVLPQYSGGLGILAGDHLKSASDLGVPLVGVGLFYDAGYFKQSLTRDGWQHETYPLLDPNNLPLTLLREPDGTPARVHLPLAGGSTLHAQVWLAQVGRVPLLLLDSNIGDNDEAMRRVTDRLYGGSAEHRLQQELLLGMGGVKAVRLYSRLTGAPEPEVYHCNEGHAGFLAVERIRELVAAEGLDFDAALEAVKAGTVFTTHTPVPAGISRYGKDLVAQYFGGGAELPGVPLEKVLALGSEDYPGGDPGCFNMAVLGLRTSKRANGVARLHGQVSREMFHPLWPGFDASEVPITSVTNGVHGDTWTDPAFAAVAAARLTEEQRATGEGWLLPAEQGGVPDGELWAVRRALRGNLVRSARARVRQSWLDRGASPAELGWTEHVLDPDVLTIGFARRVPTYKRLTLMLSDPDRLTRLLTDPERPVQIVVAGKSHPDDELGVGLIQRLVQFADNPAVRERIVFLPNYDIAMAQTLMPGCDVWLNNPLRPLEASGTSGMKGALNGALNLSIRDGWWDEWYDGRNGWAIPTADGVTDQAERDRLEAAALYDLIEEVVAPRFYDRDADGVPQRWMEMVRHTLATLGPKVQATRMVREYVGRLYTPVARGVRMLDGGGHDGARELAGWKARVRQAWPGVRVDHVEAQGVADVVNVGDRIEVAVYVSLGELGPEDVEVQLVAGRADDRDELTDFQVRPLSLAQTLEGGRYAFTGSYTMDLAGPFGYTVRVVPQHPGLAEYTELGLVAAGGEH